MARAKEKRRQFKFSLPETMLDHLQKRYNQKGWEKQLQTLASILAFEAMGEPLRLTMIQWATRISEDATAWTAFLETVEKKRGEVLDQRTADAALRSLSDAVGASGARRKLA